MTINYFTRLVYGKPLNYPVDSNVSEALGLMTGQKTITDLVQRGLERMGHHFIQVSDPKFTVKEAV